MDLEELNEVDRTLVQRIMSEQAQFDTTPACVKTFYRQISLYWRIRRVPLVIAFTFTFLLPF